MNWINEIVSPLFTEALGWTLLHSLWQGVVIMAALGLTLAFISAKASKLRYLISILAAVSMLIWTGFTFVQEYKAAADSYIEGVAIQQTMTYWNVMETQIEAGFNFQDWLSTMADSMPSLLTPTIPWITFGWLLGFVIFSVRWLGGIVYLRHLRTHDIIPVAYLWQLKVNKIARKMGIGKTILLRESSRVTVPMVIGHLKPIILIPLGIINGLTPNQLEAIFAHELAHIQRYDFIINLLLSQIEALFFYHPAFWWISRQIRDEREHCCDDIAISICKDPVSYARTLADLEARNLQTVPLTMGLAGRKNHLLTRIQRIVMPNLNNSQSGPRAFFALLLVVFLTGTAWLSPTPESVIENNTSEAISDGPLQLFPGIVQEIEPRQNTIVMPSLSVEITNEVPQIFSVETPEWNIVFIDSPPPAPNAPLFPQNNATYFFDNSEQPQRFEFGDFDNDGQSDFLIQGQNAEGFEFDFDNDGEADFLIKGKNAEGNAIDGSLFDFDNDGEADFFIQSQNAEGFSAEGFKDYFNTFKDQWEKDNEGSFDNEEYREAREAYERAMDQIADQSFGNEGEPEKRKIERIRRLQERLAREQERNLSEQGRAEQERFQEEKRRVLADLQRRGEEERRKNDLFETKAEKKLERELAVLGRELKKLEGLAQLKELGKLKELKKLESLKQLEGLAQLRELEGLAKLKELEALEELQSLNQLAKLNELQKLEELKELEKLRRLEGNALDQSTNMKGFKSTFAATLRVDGYIKSSTDIIKVSVYENMLKINGHKLTGDEFDRYMELMEEYDLDLSDGTIITILLD